MKFGKRPAWLEQLARKPSLLRALSLALLLLTVPLLLLYNGIGAGIFAVVIYAMALLSTVFLLLPYRYLRWTHLICLFLIGLALELFIC
ncbi:hypothetical protein ACL9RF_09095 [Sphingobacterium sp. Mn56C]